MEPAEAGGSVLDRSDAVSKLVWMLAVAATGLTVSGVAATMALLALVLAVGLALGRIPALALVRRLVPYLLAGVWLAVLLALTGRRGGAVLFGVGPYAVTGADLRTGAALGARLVVFGAAGVVFTATTRPRRLVADLTTYLRLPYRAAFAVTAAMRFLPQLREEARTIRRAQAARGVPGVGPAALDLRAVRLLAVPLLAGALRRVQLTAIAMDARGFGAYRTRTVLDRPHRHPAGVALAAFQLALFAAALGWTVADGAITLPRAPIGGVSP